MFAIIILLFTKESFMTRYKKIINADSALRHFPANSDDKQTLFFDGIRYSMEMANLSYVRLQETLLDLTLNFKTKKPETNSFFVPIILDAWSIVDSVHRLRTLVSSTPGLKKKSYEYQSFERSTASVKELRNFVQHLDTQTHKLTGQNLPVWGVLSWLCVTDPKNKSGFTCTLVAGTIFDMKGLPMENPSGKKFFSSVDYITLTAGESVICLSDLMRKVYSLLRYLESELKGHTQKYPRSSNDILILGEFKGKNNNPENSK